MLKLNFMIGKSVRPLAFSLVTASSLIALLSPTLAMDASPLSRIEILKQHRAAKQTLEAVTKDVDLALVEFQTAGERIAQEQTLENFQLFGAAEKKKTESLKILEVAKENYNKLEKMKNASDEARKLESKKSPKPVGEETELVKSAEGQFRIALEKFSLAKTALGAGNKEESVSLFKEASEAQQWLPHALTMIEKKIKDEQNLAQKKFLEYIVNNLKKEEQTLSGQMDTLRVQLGSAALPPPPVIKSTAQAQPLPGQRTFTRPVDEAAEAEAKKAAEARAIAEAKVAAEAQAQLAAHQKWMDEQAEQRKQAATVPVQPVQDEQENGAGNAFLQALRAKQAGLKVVQPLPKADEPVKSMSVAPLPLVDLGDWETDVHANHLNDETDDGRKAVIRRDNEMSAQKMNDMTKALAAKHTPPSVQQNSGGTNNSELNIPTVIHGEIKKVTNIPLPPKSAQQIAEENDNDDNW